MKPQSPKASKASLTSGFGMLALDMIVTALSTKASVTFSLKFESFPVYLG